jgi:hypothetical protein
MELTWKQLKDELARQGYINTLWHKDDIEMLLEKRSIEHTDEDLNKLRAFVEKHFDAQVGISWDVLDGYIDSYLEENSIG